MCSLRLESEEITSMLKNIMQQPYVEKYINEPFIDQDKMMFLTDIYRYSDMLDDDKRTMIMTVMLVQSALDTHERIPAQNGVSMSETEKQLSVLAGDYYSGLYYTLLAEQGQIHMIQVLANAIREINEYKMNLYYEEAANFSEFIYYLMKIESLLIVHVAQLWHIDPNYIRVIEKVCLINRLERELSVSWNSEDTYVSPFLQQGVSNFSNEQMIQYIKREKEKQHMELDHLLSLLPCASGSIYEAIKEKCTISYHTTIAEEG